MLSKGIDMKYYLAEHTGKETGCCAGRSSFHFCFPEDGVFLMSGFIGYNFSPVVGLGWAAKRRGNKQVVMNCSGDGSYNEGRAHEALLMAANWRLPIIFFCENNGMAIFADANEMHPTPHISSMAKAYDMPSEIVDGQDVFACAEAALRAIKRARSGQGPTFIEAKTIRFREHDIGTPDLLGSTPRTKEQIKQLRARDPVEIATRRVLETSLLTQDEIDAIYAATQVEIDAAEQFADESPVPSITEQELLQDVFYDRSRA